MPKHEQHIALAKYTSSIKCNTVKIKVEMITIIKKNQSYAFVCIIGDHFQQTCLFLTVIFNPVSPLCYAGFNQGAVIVFVKNRIPS